MTSPVADFVIVGGGTAGAALASRLSEDSSKQVVLLEAGQDRSEDPRVNTPALWPALLGSDADWDFLTIPQKELIGKCIPLPHGKMIGGSSGLNGLAFIATSKINLDTWSKLGNPGWDWQTMKPYYDKTYTLTLPSTESQRRLGLEYVTTDSTDSRGPLHASFPDAIDDPVAPAWLQSLRELGHPMTSDPFSGAACGGYTNAASIDPVTKTRSYSTTAYYEPAKHRTNLTVITGALVEKVLFTKSTATVEANSSSTNKPRASGVQYLKDGETHTIQTKGEIILSAGAFNSPKLLELSGIGSKAILEAHGIPVVFDNPNVGENLQDHVLAGLSFEVNDSIETKDDLMRQNPQALGAAMQSYQSKQYGPFTVGGNYSSALLPLSDFQTEQGKAELEEVASRVATQKPFHEDLQNFVMHILQDPKKATGGYFTYPAQANFAGENSGADLVKSKLPGNYITIAVSILHPLSTGSSHLASRNAEDKPIIDPRYLTHPLDIEVLARHTRYIEEIVSSPALKAVLKPGGKRSPGAPADMRKASLDEIKRYVRSAATSTWHPVGTCSMMPLEKGGVVDPALRVYGVDGLRVVDASIMPIVTRGNTQTSVYAIAEKAADLIKKGAH